MTLSKNWARPKAGNQRSREDAHDWSVMKSLIGVEIGCNSVAVPAKWNGGPLDLPNIRSNLMMSESKSSECECISYYEHCACPKIKPKFRASKLKRNWGRQTATGFLPISKFLHLNAAEKWARNRWQLRAALLERHARK